MKTCQSRAAMLGFCAALAGSVASAQTPQVAYDISWRALPSNQSFFVMFGDYVQVVVSVRFSPPVGTQIQHPSVPGGAGTVAGLGSISFDLKACNGPSFNSPWTLSGTGFQGTTGNTWGLRSGWSFGGAGVPQNDTSILGIGTAQFLPPGVSANPMNPISEMWRAKLTINSFMPGLQSRFTCYPVHQTVLVKYGEDVNGPLYYALAAVADPSTIQVWQDPGGVPGCFSSIDQPPTSRSVPEGLSTTFSVHAVAATGCGFTYQWKRGCTNLTDGGRITGATTANLRIDGVVASDVDIYEVVVNGNHSRGALLSVTCYANCDGSTAVPTLNTNDFQCFLNRFAAADSYANCDASTSPPTLNANDFQCYLNRFAAGCS